LNAEIQPKYAADETTY